MNIKEDRKVINRFAYYVKRINETRFEQMDWFDYRAEPEVVKGHYKRIAQEILKDEVFKEYQEYKNELLE